MLIIPSRLSSLGPIMRSCALCSRVEWWSSIFNFLASHKCMWHILISVLLCLVLLSKVSSLSYSYCGFNTLIFGPYLQILSPYNFQWVKKFLLISIGSWLSLGGIWHSRKRFRDGNTICSLGPRGCRMPLGWGRSVIFLSGFCGGPGPWCLHTNGLISVIVHVSKFLCRQLSLFLIIIILVPFLKIC